MASKFLRMAALSLCAGGLAAAPVLAENAADVARTRHDSYRDIGAAFKNINDQLKSGSPQLYVIQLSARQIRNYSQQQFSWFPAGSGPQPGLKTSAKAEIWTQPAQFKQAQDAFAAQANAFYQAAASGDMTKIQAQARQLGQACASCHRTFREKDQS